MCMICVDFMKQKMTTQDARRALREMRDGMDPEHAREVSQMIVEEEKKQAAQRTDDDD